MTGIRLSLACPGADSGALLALAKRAQQYNLGVWIGDPLAKAANHDDSYVMATAGALAVATEDVRIGVWLTLRGAAPAIRLAEDVSVVDQLSGGRLNLGLVAPVQSDPAWRDLVVKFLDCWYGWPLSDGRGPAVTPPPAQPILPTVIVGEPELARQLERWRTASYSRREPKCLDRRG